MNRESKKFLQELMVVRSEQMLDTIRDLRTYMDAGSPDAEFLDTLAPVLVNVLDKFAAAGTQLKTRRSI